MKRAACLNIYKTDCQNRYAILLGGICGISKGTFFQGIE